MRWAGHVERVGERRGVHRVWCRNVRKRDHLENPGVDGRTFTNWDVRARIGLIWLRIGTGGGHM
jgi:hypothetical protein